MKPLSSYARQPATTESELAGGLQEQRRRTLPGYNIGPVGQLQERYAAIQRYHSPQGFGSPQTRRRRPVSRRRLSLRDQSLDGHARDMTRQVLMDEGPPRAASWSSHASLWGEPSEHVSPQNEVQASANITALRQWAVRADRDLGLLTQRVPVSGDVRPGHAGGPAAPAGGAPR